MMYAGIDVSRWQGDIDFEQVREDGIRIVYIKASEGQDTLDPYFERNSEKAKRAGLLVGFYHYVTAVNEEEARAEAAHFHDAIRDKDYRCRPAMDYEYFGRMEVRAINQVAKAFLEELERISGHKPLVYSDVYNASSTFDDPVTTYPLWLAEYGVRNPGRGIRWDNWEGWQYDDRGDVRGVNGYVDLDLFREDVIVVRHSQC